MEPPKFELLPPKLEFPKLELLLLPKVEPLFERLPKLLLEGLGWVNPPPPMGVPKELVEPGFTNPPPPIGLLLPNPPLEGLLKPPACEPDRPPAKPPARPPAARLPVLEPKLFFGGVGCLKPPIPVPPEEVDDPNVCLGYPDDPPDEKDPELELVDPKVCFG